MCHIALSSSQLLLPLLLPFVRLTATTTFGWTTTVPTNTYYSTTSYIARVGTNVWVRRSSGACKRLPVLSSCNGEKRYEPRSVGVVAAAADIWRSSSFCCNSIKCKVVGMLYRRYDRVDVTRSLPARGGTPKTSWCLLLLFWCTAVVTCFKLLLLLTIRCWKEWRSERDELIFGFGLFDCWSYNFSWYKYYRIDLDLYLVPVSTRCSGLILQNAQHCNLHLSKISLTSPWHLWI